MLQLRPGRTLVTRMPPAPRFSSRSQRAPGSSGIRFGKRRASGKYVGKRHALGKGSRLRWTVYSITNISSLDLRRLIGGNSYTLSTQLNIKSYTFHIYALGNTRANSFLFINTKLATLLIRHCDARSKPLPYIVLVTSYDGQRSSKIIYYIRLILQINNRRFVRIPFCITPLRIYNVIIGRK
jgi:hypothetical protein